MKQFLLIVLLASMLSACSQDDNKILDNKMTDNDSLVKDVGSDLTDSDKEDTDSNTDDSTDNSDTDNNNTDNGNSDTNNGDTSDNNSDDSDNDSDDGSQTDTDNDNAVVLKENQVTLTTNLGNIVIELYPDKAPVSVENFLAYVDSGYYNDTIFHRVIDDFMIQGGGFTKELTKKTTNDPIINESNNGLKNEVGTIAMARTTDPNSATSQFFINVKDNAFLDYSEKEDGTVDKVGYAVFGKVIAGMDVVNAIKVLKTSSQGGAFANLPDDMVTITKANNDGKADDDKATAPTQVDITTTLGNIRVQLDAEKAPKAVENFLAYVNDGFYKDTIFHRVIKDFMVQGGGFDADLTEKSTKTPIKSEANNGLLNIRGTIAMSRKADADSATSQFFFNVADNDFLNYKEATTTEQGNAGYTVFGKVVEGMDVVDDINQLTTIEAKTQTDISFTNLPLNTIKIESIALVK